VLKTKILVIDKLSRDSTKIGKEGKDTFKENSKETINLHKKVKNTKDLARVRVSKE
jgi:hypothetical protein